MATQLIRFIPASAPADAEPRWGVGFGATVAPPEDRYATTGRLVMFILKHFMSDAGKWKAFIAKARTNPLYLKPDDVIALSIRCDDGVLDLGQQRTRVVAA